jgi:hypothetical protein
VTRLATALLLCAAAAASAATAGARTQTSLCKGSQLAGSLTAVPGSAGAGNISYRLVLRNRSDARCQLTGLPAGRLLGKTGKPLPTHVQAEFPGALSAVLVRLAPGQRSKATARFSPDVSGVGETTVGRCEPVAYWLRVDGQGGGTTKVKITPPTSVCEHGRLLFSAYAP